MKDNKKVTLSIVAMIAIGLNFGVWVQDINAGIFSALVTYYAFMFRYDED